MYTLANKGEGEKEEEKYFYEYLNEMLRRKDIHPDEKKPWEPYLFYLERALSKFPDVQRHTKVYRGLRGSEAKELLEKNYTVGKTIKWSGYTSTTKKPNIAVNFAREDGVVMEISILNGKDISKYSFTNNESEVLLSPVVSLTVNKPLYYDEDKGVLMIGLQQDDNQEFKVMVSYSSEKD